LQPQASGEPLAKPVGVITVTRILAALIASALTAAFAQNLSIGGAW
jgi:hypothetical protein